MKRSYRISVKTLAEDELRNFRISASLQNFDEFMTKISEIVSCLGIESFRIDYPGKDGVEYCILHPESFQQFINEEVDDVFVKETVRPSLPTVQPTPPAHPTPPAAATMSCRAFICRLIGYFVPQSHHKLE
ncbi:uncharacterized protein LOC119083991 [Bradysia coprophila]|uniref:uncharacterized protein LOC119083991 n=1 Tax=Bradysia coprophila TaxID=38358 RepID=UPI00187DC9BC|nr:uncharacterized protein LOC119083991 [Bradysia coprophila]